MSMAHNKCDYSDEQNELTRKRFQGQSDGGAVNRGRHGNTGAHDRKAMRKGIRIQLSGRTSQGFHASVGIDFNTAIHVFDDEDRLEIFDIEHSVDEDRYNTIGRVHDILFVVYTERGEKVRLISARLASAAERRLYYDYNS